MIVYGWGRELSENPQKSEKESQPSGHVRLPRGGRWLGEYSLRDFAAKIMVQLDDFAELDRYREQNQAERSRTHDAQPVVLMGDSITEFWGADLLPDVKGARLINRGVAGQNSSVMLLRFQADVIELGPEAVVILAGTNDLRAYVGEPADLGPKALERLSQNLTAMADMAEGRGIRVVLATLPPVGSDLACVARSPDLIRKVNASISHFAQQRGYALADYFTALAGPDGTLPANLAEDGVHPNADGYRRMAPILLDALSRPSIVTDPIP